jgi:outer membrane protein assembly factor BamB
MSFFDDAEVIATYTVQQAVADGVLVEIFKNRWGQLSGGKPIVATAHLSGEVSRSGLLEIWNEFVSWRKHVMPTVPEEDRLFTTTMNGDTVWVIEDDVAYTLMYPQDY